jgi:hypothetical protein
MQNLKMVILRMTEVLEYLKIKKGRHISNEEFSEW